jgi:hypothetical protein
MATPRSFVLASEPGLVPVDAMNLFSGSGKSTAQVGDGNDFAHIGGHVLLDSASGLLSGGAGLARRHESDSAHRSINRIHVGKRV